MKIAISTVLSFLLLGIAQAGPLSWFWKAGGAPPAFVNDFVGIGMQFDPAGHLEGVDILGRASKPAMCERNSAITMDYTYAHGLVPKGHTLVTTCLHVSFAGKIAHGQVIVQPSKDSHRGFIAVAMEYTSVGKFYGAQALGRAPDLKTCIRNGHDTIDSSYKGKKIRAGNSLLIYCVAVPPAHPKKKINGMSV